MILDRGISVALVLGLLLGTGCHRGQQENVEPEPGVRFTIRSHHQSDLVIVVIHDRLTERIGTVAPGTTRVFMVPARRLGPSRMIQLGAFHLGASQGHITEELYVTDGEEVIWNLEKYLAESVVYLR